MLRRYYFRPRHWAGLGAAGAARGADLRAGRAPGRGDLPVPGPARGLRRAPGLGRLGDDELRGVAVVEVPDVFGDRPGARPGGTGTTGAAGDPGGVRRGPAVVCEGAGADP